MSEFPRYYPENSGKSEKGEKVELVRNLASELLSIKADDEEAWIKKSGIVTDMFTKAGYGATSFQGLKEVQDDANKVENQKVLALEAKDVLVTGMYEAMLDTKDMRVEKVLGAGNISGIEEEWPIEFKGVGREIVDKVTGDSKITDVLVELDNSWQRNKNGGELGKKQFSKKLEDAYIKIDELEGLNEEGRKGQKLVMTYLGSELQDSEKATIKGEESGGFRSSSSIDSTNDPEIKEYLRAQMEYAKASAEYAREHHILESQIREVSLDELLDSYMKIKAPRERAPQMWEYEVPKFMNGMSPEKWRKLLNFNDAWLGAIYTKRGSSEYNNSLEKMKDGILSMKSLEEGDLKIWYEDKTLKLKEVMHEISCELFVPKPVTENVPVVDKKTGSVTFKDITRTIYVFDTKIDSSDNKEGYIKGSKVQQLVDNEGNYKLALAKRLVDKNIVKNIKVAKLSVAMAMDVMEMGGVFSVADGLRKLSWESDALRLAQRPERKYSSKVGGGELFAGPWTELANTLSEGDPKRSMELIKSWKVVPELLSGSFLDQKLFLANGEKTKKTMMEMIYDDEKIPFRDLGNDLYFSWRKDHVMPAARTWMYIANKVPLEFSKNRENDTVISQWRADLYNDINQLRKNEDGLLPISVVEGAIGGSLGLWPFEGPYLRVSSKARGGSTLDYLSAAAEVIRLLGLSEKESREVQDFFGVDKKYNHDLSDKFVAYSAVRNVTQPEWYKEKNRKILLRPRGKK